MDTWERSERRDRVSKASLNSSALSIIEIVVDKINGMFTESYALP